MKILASTLAAMTLTTGCFPAGADSFRVSNRYPICATVPGTLLSAPRVDNGPNFEYVDFSGGEFSGTIYVGDFPDYPRFSPDQKFYEPIGHVTFLGMTTHQERYKELFRFGLGEEPAIHVLYLFPPSASLPAESQPLGGLHKCERNGT